MEACWYASGSRNGEVVFDRTSMDCVYGAQRSGLLEAPCDGWIVRIASIRWEVTTKVFEEVYWDGRTAVRSSRRREAEMLVRAGEKEGVASYRTVVALSGRRGAD